MKKLLLLVASLVMTTMVSAQEVVSSQTFVDDLYVTVNGETTGPQETSVNVDYLDNGNITLVLKNFILDSGDGDYIPVGNIEVDNMALTQETGVSYGTFHYDGDVTIKNGDDGIDWVGPWLLGTIPIDMSGELNDNQLYLTIDIDLSSSLGQIIYVKFGEEIVDNVEPTSQYQFPNSDFESEFVTAYVSSSIFSGTTTYTEPLGWHGYATIAGSIGSLGRSGSKLVASNDVHEGSTGSQSACAVATAIWGIVANGIMTNGQVYSGSMTATDGAGNYNFSDQTNSGDTDTYYDNSQFYTPFTGRPDYMNVWLKFVPAAEDNGNARVSVYLHKDGTVMYDPTDNVEDMSIVVAHAEESIPTNGGAWTQYSIPFDYDGEGQYDGTATPALILATFSTNETPGAGAADDKLYIDDIEMVYLSELQSATYNGEAITFTDGAAGVDAEYDASLLECVATGVGASIEIEEPTEENGNVLTITVKGDNISEDESNYHTYTVQFAAPEEEEPDLELHATYGGVELTDGAVIEGTYDADKLEVTAGEGATVATEYDDATLTLTITVTAEDGSESRTYTVTFTIATGIQAVTATTEDESVYDLMGRQVTGTPQKGIYVKKGKKVLVK